MPRPRGASSLAGSTPVPLASLPDTPWLPGHWLCHLCVTCPGALGLTRCSPSNGFLTLSGKCIGSHRSFQGPLEKQPHSSWVLPRPTGAQKGRVHPKLNVGVWPLPRTGGPQAPAVRCGSQHRPGAAVSPCGSENSTWALCGCSVLCCGFECGRACPRAPSSQSSSLRKPLHRKEGSWAPPRALVKVY